MPSAGAGGAVAERVLLRHDGEGEPTVLEVGHLKLFVIERCGRCGVRMRDPDSAMRRAFRGTAWYPFRADMRVTTQLTPYAEKRRVEFPVGTVGSQSMLAPGVVRFSLAGRDCELEPVEDEGQLFFIFKDATAGRTTYGGGRFLYAPLPDAQGRVVLDFNKAKNPPCVFTPFATCPLAKKHNQLPFALGAGEMLPPGYEDNHH